MFWFITKGSFEVCRGYHCWWSFYEGGVAKFSICENVKVTGSEGVLDEAVRGCDAGRPFDDGLVKGVKRKLFDLFVAVDPNEKIFLVKL